jgi:hypothetical protein
VPGGIVDLVAADRIDAGLAGDLLDLPVLAIGLGAVVAGLVFIRLRRGRFGIGGRFVAGRVLGGRVLGGFLFRALDLELRLLGEQGFAVRDRDAVIGGCRRIRRRPLEATALPA